MRIKQSVAKIGAVLLLAFYMATSGAVLLPVSTQTVSAAGICQKEYNAWDKADNSTKSKTYDPLISCITGVAKGYCIGDNLQSGNKSTADKKEACVGWYLYGFKKVGDCNKPESAQNEATCKAGDDSRKVYDDNTDSADGDGSDKAEPIKLGTQNTDYKCGGGDTGSINTAINFGCKGKGSALLDLMFAIIRFMSNGVGLVIIASLIWGGIQYSSSRGDPQATAAAVNRFRSVFTALIIYAFAYAIVNYLIPGQLLG